MKTSVGECWCGVVCVRDAHTSCWLYTLWGLHGRHGSCDNFEENRITSAPNLRDNVIGQPNTFGCLGIIRLTNTVNLVRSCTFMDNQMFAHCIRQRRYDQSSCFDSRWNAQNAVPSGINRVSLPAAILLHANAHEWTRALLHRVVGIKAARQRSKMGISAGTHTKIGLVKHNKIVKYPRLICILHS